MGCLGSNHAISTAAVRVSKKATQQSRWPRYTIGACRRRDVDLNSTFCWANSAGAAEFGRDDRRRSCIRGRSYEKWREKGTGKVHVTFWAVAFLAV